MGKITAKFEAVESKINSLEKSANCDKNIYRGPEVPEKGPP
jgi:hypothetical protein